MKTKILIIISTLFFSSVGFTYSQNFMDEFLEYDIKEFTIYREPLQGDTTKIIGMNFISNGEDELVYSYKYKSRTEPFDSITKSRSISKTELKDILSNDLIVDIDSLDLLSYFNEEMKEEYLNAMYSHLNFICFDNRPTETEYNELVRNELKRLDTISKETITFILEYPEVTGMYSTNFNIEIVNYNKDTLKIFSETNPEMNPFSLPWVVKLNEDKVNTYNVDLYIFFSDLYFGKTKNNFTNLNPYDGLYPFMSKMRRVFIREGIIKILPNIYDE